MVLFGLDLFAIRRKCLVSCQAFGIPPRFYSGCKSYRGFSAYDKVLLDAQCSKHSGNFSSSPHSYWLASEQYYRLMMFLHAAMDDGVPLSLRLSLYPTTVSTIA